MDPGRYGPRQGWDDNSDLEGYDAGYKPSLRVGSSYDERRFIDDRYPRNACPRDILERDNYPPPPSDVGFWHNSRKRNYEEEYPFERASRRRDSYNDIGACQEYDKFRDGYHAADNNHDHGVDRSARFGDRDRDDYGHDDYVHRTRTSYQHREDSRERDYGYGRHSYDSDYDRSSKRDGNLRKRDYRDHEHDKRSSNREKGQSPQGRYGHSQSRSRSRSRSRSWSCEHDNHLRSRSPRGRSRSHREDSFDDGRYGRRGDRDEKRQREYYAVGPSATVLLKGLSQKTTEEDLYQILAEWGPLRHVRVIKERNSGLSRGFAFVDFPSVGAAQLMMDRIGDDGLVVDGRKVFFEYSSKPTAGSGSFNQDNQVKSARSNRRNMIVPSDWMCIICGCINFARRTSCFQCNEPRTDDAPPADVISANQAALGKKGSEAGPTHVLVVRGLDENADEEMLRYEFSKHTPIKDLRLVRDKFTHVSRGFAFVHFYSVEDATKALEATNGTAFEKNGQILRVAYAKSVLGPGSGAPASSQSSSLAAAAIEAAAFAQQYDAVGWAPKEYKPDDKQNTGEQGRGEISAQKTGLASQAGFVWDEASGYYYDAASGFYYDGNTGLYYDGNNGTWYSFDHQTQQYVPCTDQNNSKTPSVSEPSKGTYGSGSNRKVVISAPAATITSAEKAAASSLPDAVQAAAAAAMAAEKKEKEKAKEIKLASKGSILANKKKMSNVLTMWKQRTHEGQATGVALVEGQLSDDRDKSFASSGLSNKRESSSSSSGVGMGFPAYESQAKGMPVSNSSGGSLMGVIRGSGRIAGRSDTLYMDPSARVSASSAHAPISSSLLNDGEAPTSSPFKTDASALGSYATPSASGSSKRRFSEMPLSLASSNQRDQSHTGYRDRAAERRSLYGSYSAADGSDLEFADSNRDVEFKKSSLGSSMPFPPGVGSGRGAGDPNINTPSYEVITADKAIDESNVGNRMLRSMGWQEGAGLGKDGSGVIEPVQAQAVERRAGLGSQKKKRVVDPSFEVQAGDSYRTIIHKKALARFQEMS